MSITIANLVAQVSCDITQLKRGLDESDARVKLSELRGAASARRVVEMQRMSGVYQERATLADKKVGNINIPQLEAAVNAAKKNKADADKTLKAAAATVVSTQKLYDASKAAGGGVASAATSNARALADKEYEKAKKSATVYAERQLAAENRVNTAIARRSALELQAAELRHKSSRMAIEAVATEDSRAQAALVMEKYARRKEQDAREHGIRAGNAASAATMKAGAAGLVGLGGADVVGNQVNQMLLTVAHNTSLSDDGIKKMIGTVKRLGEESGLSLEEIAQGYRKLENYGFDAAASEKLLNQAMKVSVAQGTDMSATTETLTRVMKEYNIPIVDGVKAMNVLVATSKKSARSFTELDEVYGRMSATAANFGVSMLDTSAAFITLTRHGLDAHDAMTQFVNMIYKIQQPSKQVQTALRNIDAEAKKLGVTGISLVNAFSPSGLRSLGVGGVFDMIKKAADQVEHVPGPDLAAKLFPMRRGQLGAAIAVGTGVRDWGNAVNELKRAAQDGTTIDKQYQESLAQVNQQLDRLKNIGLNAASSVGTALAPAIRDAIQWVQQLAGRFNSLGESEKDTIVKSIAYASAFLLVGGAVGKLIVGLYSLSTAAAALNITMATAVPQVAAVVAVVGLLVVALKKWYDLVNIGNVMAEEQKEYTKSTLESTKAAYDNGQSIGQLVNQYRTMEEQAAKTHKPVQGMQQLLDRISQMAPELVSGFNSEGHAIGLIGSAADGATAKLAGLASAARAAAISAQSALLPQAQLEESNAMLKAVQLRARLQRLQSTVNPGLQGIEAYNRYGFNDPHRPQPKDSVQLAKDRAESGSVAAQLRDAESAHKATIDKLNSLRGTINYNAQIPQSVAAVHKRSTDELKKDVDIMANAYNNAKKAVVDFHAAAAKDAAVPDKMAKTLTWAQSTYGMLSKEYAARLKAIGGDTGATDAMGLARKSTMPGADPLAGLYDKPKKPKKAKKTEEEKTLDDYRNSIEELYKAEYKLNHAGMGSREFEARWDTMSHGSAAAKELKGRLQDLTQAQVDYYVKTARRADQHEKGAESMKSFGEAASGLGPSMSKAMSEFRGRTDASAASWAEKIAEPLGEKLSVYDRVLRDITKDTELVARKGIDWAKSMAAQAQRNTDAAESANQYERALQEVDAVLQRSRDEANGKQTHAEAFALSMASKEYDKLNSLQRMAVWIRASLADAQDKVNAKTKAGAELTAYLSDEVKRSAAEAVKGVDPATARRMDFERAAIDRYGAEAYGKLGVGDKASVDQQVAASYKTVSADESRIESQKKLAEIIQKVKDKMAELTEKLKVNTDGIQINQEQWDALTLAQQQNVQQTVQLAQAKDRIKSFIDGIDQVFTKTLDDVHQHGFRNFFTDVVNGFNNMCFQLAETWLNSQFLKLMNNAFGGNNTTSLFGGGGNAPGSGGGSGGLMGTLSSLVGGFAGPAITSMFSASSAQAAGAAQALLGGFSGMASGGSVFGDRSYIVGERGPELFTPNTHGRITPNGQFGGSTTFVMHVHGVTDAGSFNQSRHQITQDMIRAVQVAQRR